MLCNTFIWAHFSCLYLHFLSGFDKFRQQVYDLKHKRAHPDISRQQIWAFISDKIGCDHTKMVFFFCHSFSDLLCIYKLERNIYLVLNMLIDVLFGNFVWTNLCGEEEKVDCLVRLWRVCFVNLAFRLSTVFPLLHHFFRLI